MDKPIRAINEEERQRGKRSIDHEGSIKTICQILRDIYLIAQRRNDTKTQDLAVDAYCYAKRMNSALRKRDATYDKDWWEIKDATIPKVSKEADSVSRREEAMDVQPGRDSI